MTRIGHPDPVSRSLTTGVADKHLSDAATPQCFVTCCSRTKALDR